MRVTRVWYGLLFILILIGMGGLLASCQPATEAEAVAKAEDTCPAPIEEPEAMNSSEDETMILTKEHGIPPIDMAAPEHTETATFSLG